MNAYTEDEMSKKVCHVMLASYLVSLHRINKPQCIEKSCMAFQAAGFDIREGKQVEVYRCGILQ